MILGWVGGGGGCMRRIFWGVCTYWKVRSWLCFCRFQTIESTATLERLRPGHWYQFRVYAVNIYGTRGPSNATQPFKLSKGSLYSALMAPTTYEYSIVISLCLCWWIFKRWFSYLFLSLCICLWVQLWCWRCHLNKPLCLLSCLSEYLFYGL